MEEGQVGWLGEGWYEIRLKRQVQIYFVKDLGNGKFLEGFKYVDDINIIVFIRKNYQQFSVENR